MMYEKRYFSIHSKILHEICCFSFTSFYHNIFLSHRKHLSYLATVYTEQYTLYKNNNEIFKINKLLFSTPMTFILYAHIARVSNHHEKIYKTDWTYLFISYFQFGFRFFDEKICFMSHICWSYSKVMLWILPSSIYPDFDVNGSRRVEQNAPFERYYACLACGMWNGFAKGLSAY